jgi:hypothetical protein
VSDVVSARAWELDQRLRDAYLDIQETTRWYSLARPYLWLHIRRRLPELINRYVQLRGRAPSGAPIVHALDEHVQTLRGMEDSFALLRKHRSVSVLKHVAPTGISLLIGTILGVPLAGVGGVAAYIAVFHKCFCVLVRVWLYGTSAVLFLSGVVGFQEKRDVLLKHDLYNIERQLWEELGIRKRHREIQLDVLSFFGVALAIVIVKYAPAVEAHHRLNWRFNPFWLVAFWCVVAVAVLIASFSRPWAWGRNTTLPDPEPPVTAEES